MEGQNQEMESGKLLVQSCLSVQNSTSSKILNAFFFITYFMLKTSIFPCSFRLACRIQGMMESSIPQDAIFADSLGHICSLFLYISRQLCHMTKIVCSCQTQLEFYIPAFRSFRKPAFRGFFQLLSVRVPTAWLGTTTSGWLSSPWTRGSVSTSPPGTLPWVGRRCTLQGRERAFTSS